MSTVIFLGKPPSNVEKWIKDHYVPKLDEPLCFTAVDAGATIAFNKVGYIDTANIVYATEIPGQIDELDWKPYEFNKPIELTNPGYKAYFRAADVNNISFFRDNNRYYRFATTDGKKIAASGNIQTLMKADGSNLDISGQNNCYNSLFAGCTSLTQAPALPATTLSLYCYSNMFGGCTSLTQAPALPATILASYCYYYMFSGCTSLTSAPATLPAKTLVSWCYSGMFNGCTSLSQAPFLPATEMAGSCYHSMFNGCTSLSQAPFLPATTLASSCYNQMFSGCSKLSSIDVDFTTWDPSGATFNWVDGVGTEATGKKTFTCPSTLPKISDKHHIPSGWTIKEKQ